MSAQSGYSALLFHGTEVGDLIKIHVEDQNHLRTQTVPDDDNESLRWLADLGAVFGSGLRAIDPHGDGMLNMHQLSLLTPQLTLLLRSKWLSVEQRVMCEQVLVLAEEAINLRGYLFFDGD
jgi:hypothetical protein